MFHLSVSKEHVRVLASSSIVLPRGRCWSRLSPNEACPVGLLFWCLQLWKNMDRCFHWPALFLLSSRERNDKLNWLMHLTAPNRVVQLTAWEVVRPFESNMCLNTYTKHFGSYKLHYVLPLIENHLCVYGHTGPQGKTEWRRHRDRLGNRWMRLRCGHRTDGAGTAWHKCENRYRCGVHLERAAAQPQQSYLQDIREKQTQGVICWSVQGRNWQKSTETFTFIQYESLWLLCQHDFRGQGSRTVMEKPHFQQPIKKSCVT